MKKLLALLFMAVCAMVHAGPNDLIIQQLSDDGTEPIPRLVAKPATGDGVLFYEASTMWPKLATMGACLSFSSGVLTLQSGCQFSNAAARSSISLTTTGTVGAATYNASTGVLNIPNYAPGTGTVTSVTAGAGLSGGTITTSGTISMPNVGTAGTYNSVTTDAQGRVTGGTNTAFNYSQPAARTLAVSTSYQAMDPTRAAVIYPSFACTNATTILAASACTLQVRMGAGALTCSTGTVYYTQSLTVALGLLITQNSTNPVPIFLPTGASFIICPTAGTFTVTAVEQSAG